MSTLPKVRCLADLQLRDKVRTPLGRPAMVERFTQARCELRYMDGDFSLVILAHHHLVLVARAAPLTLNVSKILESQVREARERAEKRNGEAPSV